MIRILFGLADVMAIWIALLAAYYIRFHTGLIPIKEHQSLSLYLYSLLVSTPLYLVLLAAMGNYQERHGKLSHYERQTLIRTLVVFYLLCLSLTFLIHTQEHSRATILLTFFINLILLLLFRKAIISLQVRQWKNGENVSRILLIGTAEDTIQEMALAISKSRESGYQLAGSRLLHRDPIDLHAHETDRLILTGDLSFSEIADIVLITPAQIRIDFVPAYHIFLRSFPFKEQIGEFPLIPLNQQLFSDWNSVLKRVLDISVSATLLLIFFPFMALIALLIRMSYGSPILYRQ